MARPSSRAIHLHPTRSIYYYAKVEERLSAYYTYCTMYPNLTMAPDSLESDPMAKVKTYSSKATRRLPEQQKFMTPPLSPQPSSPRTPERKVDECNFEEPLTPTKKTKMHSLKSTRRT